MWVYKEQPFTEVMEEFTSFVYIIERLNILEDDKSPIYYIGKKTFYNKKKLKGKRILIESDWWDYYGSSEWLNEHVVKYGKDNFKRTILHLCRTAGDSGYLEAKEHIDKNVLHIDENGYKLYYNKNILGRYRNEPEFYLLEGDLKNYYALNSIHGNNYNKVWLNNGNINRLMPKSLADKEVGSNGWIYGRCEKHIEVNDGDNNIFIKYSEYDKDKHIPGYIKKYLTNGNIDKLLPIHEIDNFLEENKDWYIGYSKNNNYIWVTDGTTDKKIIRQDLPNYITYKPGRTNIGVKNKVSLFKDNKYIWVNSHEVEDMLKEGWSKKGRNGGYNRFFISDGLNQKSFLSEEDKNNFLDNNKDWYDGQLPKENFNTKDKVFAINMLNDSKVCVTKEEYENNKDLTSIKTKKIKVKSKNRIIFKGYVTKFFQDFDLPKSLILESARNNGAIIFKQKGKYTVLNDLKYSATYIK